MFKHKKKRERLRKQEQLQPGRTEQQLSEAQHHLLNVAHPLEAENLADSLRIVLNAAIFDSGDWCIGREEKYALLQVEHLRAAIEKIHTEKQQQNKEAS